LIQKQNELKLYPKNKTVMKIVILGGGESGVGAALLAKSKGYEVFLSDKSALSDKYKEILEQNDIPYEEGQHNEEFILDADEIIKSPGFLIKLN
jgi:UDP-N-acetylmuramoylalanine--D-glutamate ligase